MENRLVLNSWKEIADYMGRGVRTVQRYERDLNLPVHRPAGKSRSAVVAFADEIDNWMREGRLLSGNGSPPKPLPVNLPEWQRLIANSEVLLRRADTLRANLAELVRLVRETEQRRKIMQAHNAPRKLSKILREKTQALHAKMAGLSELVERGGGKRSIT